MLLAILLTASSLHDPTVILNVYRMPSYLEAKQTCEAWQKQDKEMYRLYHDNSTEEGIIIWRNYRRKSTNMRNAYKYLMFTRFYKNDRKIQRESLAKLRDIIGPEMVMPDMLPRKMLWTLATLPQLP
jgi:hypothetical protein